MWGAKLMTIPKDTLTVTIGKAEALILFELLADFHRQNVLPIKDNADRLALVRMHGALESTLTEPFSKEYDQILEAARTCLLSEWGNK
jgi:hypothetical protein